MFSSVLQSVKAELKTQQTDCEEAVTALKSANAALELKTSLVTCEFYSHRHVLLSSRLILTWKVRSLFTSLDFEDLKCKAIRAPEVAVKEASFENEEGSESTDVDSQFEDEEGSESTNDVVALRKFTERWPPKDLTKTRFERREIFLL